MRDRVLLLGAAQLGLSSGGLLFTGRYAYPQDAPSIPLLVGYTVVVTVLGLLPRMNVEFRRHAFQLTPTDVAMVIGLFTVGPWWFVAIGMFAEVVASLRHHASPLKTAFNLVQLFGGLVAAAMVFAALGHGDPLDPVAWLAGAVAVAACATWDLLSTAAVLSFAEGHPFRSMLHRLVPAAMAGVAVAALLGIAALVLFTVTPFGPLLFAPVLAVLVISTLGMARQRAERVHFERLYEASSNLAELVGLHDMLGRVATEARGMVTGAAAICSTVTADGTPVGVLVDDGGTRTAPPATLERLVAVTADRSHGQLDATEVERDAQVALPRFRSLVWAVKRTDDGTPLLLAVFRERPGEDQEDRPEILTAFVSHAAALVANVGLHAEVQEALARQVELNRQKGEFVAAVSHELRTPLAAVLGSVQTVRRLSDRMPRDEQHRVLEMGLAQGVRLQGLIEDLLLVAAADHRQGRVTREMLPVGPLLASLGSELLDLVDDRLTVEVADDAGAVFSDEDKLRRIVLNLVDNARKYAPTSPIELTAHREADTIVVAVTDHGPGVPEADRERIFERFVQLDQSSTRRQGGTGLGLHLCRELADRLGGSLGLAPPGTGGCRFELRLPASPASTGVRRTPRNSPGIALQRPPGFPRCSPGSSGRADLALVAPTSSPPPVDAPAGDVTATSMEGIR